MTDLMLRDFGIKEKNRKTEIIPKTYHMSDEDKKVFLELCEKYTITSTVESYPEWLIREFRESILGILRDLLRNITAANSIYPTTEIEFAERRTLQTRAIGNCEQLLQELQYVISVVPVNAQKYMPYVDMIQYEVALLRGWRKSDNKLLKKIRAKQASPEKGDQK